RRRRSSPRTTVRVLASRTGTAVRRAAVRPSKRRSVFLATTMASLRDPRDSTGPEAQLLHKAVVNACDAIDGVTDGLLADPSKCTFDPGVLQCKGSDDAGCLTAA